MLSRRGTRRAAAGAVIAAAMALTATGCSDTSSGSATKPTTAPTTSTTMAAEHGTMTTAKRPTMLEFSGPERAKLGAQLVEARAVALRYPTRADAQAAGYEPTTPFTPGLGSHMGKDSQTQPPGATLDITKPQSYLYAGTDPDSPVDGLMYVQLGGDKPPEGFAGPLDEWSAFKGQCLAKDKLDPLFPSADSVTKEQCDKAGGRFIDITAWTIHVWVVPGWEAPGGVFAHGNSDILCADGTTNTDPVTGCPAPEAKK